MIGKTGPVLKHGYMCGIDEFWGDDPVDNGMNLSGCASVAAKCGLASVQIIP